MLDVIFVIKFIHMITMAVLFGTWACIALFTVFAYCSANTSVVALTALFVVRAEFALMAGAVLLQPLVGYALALAIGAEFTQYWLVVSSAIYFGVAAIWLANLFLELRIRKIAKAAALNSKPLPPAYRRLFFSWSALTLAAFAGLIAIMALMIWQPHWQ